MAKGQENRSNYDDASYERPQDRYERHLKRQGKSQHRQLLQNYNLPSWSPDRSLFFLILFSIFFQSNAQEAENNGASEDSYQSIISTTIICSIISLLACGLHYRLFLRSKALPQIEKSGNWITREEFLREFDLLKIETSDRFREAAYLIFEFKPKLTKSNLDIFKAIINHINSHSLNDRTILIGKITEFIDILDKLFETKGIDTDPENPPNIQFEEIFGYLQVAKEFIKCLDQPNHLTLSLMFSAGFWYVFGCTLGVYNKSKKYLFSSVSLFLTIPNMALNFFFIYAGLRDAVTKLLNDRKNHVFESALLISSIIAAGIPASFIIQAGNDLDKKTLAWYTALQTIIAYYPIYRADIIDVFTLEKLVEIFSAPKSNREKLIKLLMIGSAIVRVISFSINAFYTYKSITNFYAAIFLDMLGGLVQTSFSFNSLNNASIRVNWFVDSFDKKEFSSKINFFAIRKDTLIKILETLEKINLSEQETAKINLVINQTFAFQDIQSLKAVLIEIESGQKNNNHIELKNKIKNKGSIKEFATKISEQLAAVIANSDNPIKIYNQTTIDGIFGNQLSLRSIIDSLNDDDRQFIIQYLETPETIDYAKTLAWVTGILSNGFINGYLGTVAGNHPYWNPFAATLTGISSAAVCSRFLVQGTSYEQRVEIIAYTLLLFSEFMHADRQMFLMPKPPAARAFKATRSARDWPDDDGQYIQLTELPNSKLGDPTSAMIPKSISPSLMLKPISPSLILKSTPPSSHKKSPPAKQLINYKEGLKLE